MEALPKPVTLDNRFGSISMETAYDGDTLIVHCRLLRRSGLYARSEYTAFREFMQAVDRAYSAKIVLRKE